MSAQAVQDIAGSTRPKGLTRDPFPAPFVGCAVLIPDATIAIQCDKPELTMRLSTSKMVISDNRGVRLSFFPDNRVRGSERMPHNKLVGFSQQVAL